MDKLSNRTFISCSPITTLSLANQEDLPMFRDGDTYAVKMYLNVDFRLFISYLHTEGQQNLSPHIRSYVRDRDKPEHESSIPNFKLMVYMLCKIKTWSAIPYAP